jgi:two-component system phosphate regulon response regulator PhoB
MRSIPYRFDDLFSFGRTLGAYDQELPLPPGESVAEGEWVLAIFEIGERRRATASAARGLDKGDGTVWLGFERRDWERLHTFAEAKSEKMRAAAPVAPPPAAPPYAAPPPSRMESIPVSVDSNDDDEIDMRELRPPVPPAPAIPRGMGGASERLRSVPMVSSPQPPRPPSSSSRIPTPSGRMPAAISAHVLLVDDDPDIRDVVGAMLEAVGLIVEPATSAEAALERAREKHFDLLVLDWSLPGMTGLELCRKIRGEPALSTIPVLFLTAHSSSKDIVDAFASGADDYVAKPFRAPELGARIFGLLRRARTPHGVG